MARNLVPLWLVYPAILAAVAGTHMGLMRLPYYWDEAGYYIPAAYDFFRSGALIPYSTLSNAHPPLPSIYLALWWKFLGFSPAVTRFAMCCVAATALAGVWKIAVRTTTHWLVALATVVLTGLYPVFFAQSSLAHADLFAAAATLWALAFVLERSRRGAWLAAACFSTAVLCKETAIVTPLALAAWGLWRAVRRRDQEEAARAAVLLLPAIPLALWYWYYRSRTGFLFGNPEYLRYNAGATLSPLRIALALGHRLLHVTAHMNLFVPVLLMAACMLLPPLKEEDGAARPRIALEDQAVFFTAIAANVILFSVVGGALLTRYLLPLYPLILLMCVNTFWRRFVHWPALVMLSGAGFVAGIFVNPPYRFAPEDNLAYKDVIQLHQWAIAEIVAHYRADVVLTAWPGTDELTKPELGYVTQPVKVTAIDNFSYGQIERAKLEPESYSAAFLFSTKYDPQRQPLRWGLGNEALDERFFDFHTDLAPATVARLLDGELAWRAECKGQWAAVLHFQRADEALAGRSGP